MTHAPDTFSDADIRVLMSRALPALERAARHVRALAYRIRTPLVIVRDGVLTSEIPTTPPPGADDAPPRAWPST